MCEWSSQHSLHVQPDEVCEAAILHNIHSHNNSTKLRGIAACSSLMEQRLRQEESCESEEIREGLTAVLSDECVSVCVAAAIALHCLGQDSREVSHSLSLMYSLCEGIATRLWRHYSMLCGVDHVTILISGRGSSAWWRLGCVRSVLCRDCRYFSFTAQSPHFASELDSSWPN